MSLEKELLSCYKDFIIGLKALGEEHFKELKKELEELRKALRNKIGKEPEFLKFYVAVATQWGVKARDPLLFTATAYEILDLGVREGRAILDILKTSGGSGTNLIVGRNLLILWQAILNRVKEKAIDPLANPVAFQMIIEEVSGYSRHWIGHSPLKGGIVEGKIEPLEELKVPIGGKVLKGLKQVGFDFDGHLGKSEVSFIQGLCLKIAKMVGTNHFVIESGFWKLGKIDPRIEEKDK